MQCAWAATVAPGGSSGKVAASRSSLPLVMGPGLRSLCGMCCVSPCGVVSHLLRSVLVVSQGDVEGRRGPTSVPQGWRGA
jgi:hypothetical protein